MEEIIIVLQQYIVIIVAAICFILAELIKSIKIIDKDYIPVLMAVIGVMLNVWLNQWAFTPSILLGGLASGWASVGAFETYKNFKEVK